jgi:hypothetical protein
MMSAAVTAPYGALRTVRREALVHVRPVLVPLSAVAALAVLLAGCSGSAGDATATADTAEQRSPLAEYLDAVYGGDLSPE